jgi:hypothetical protein
VPDVPGFEPDDDYDDDDDGDGDGDEDDRPRAVSDAEHVDTAAAAPPQQSDSATADASAVTSAPEPDLEQIEDIFDPSYIELVVVGWSPHCWDFTAPGLMLKFAWQTAKSPGLSCRNAVWRPTPESVEV